MPREREASHGAPLASKWVGHFVPQGFRATFLFLGGGLFLMQWIKFYNNFEKKKSPSSLCPLSTKNRSALTHHL